MLHYSYKESGNILATILDERTTIDGLLYIYRYFIILIMLQTMTSRYTGGQLFIYECTSMCQQWDHKKQNEVLDIGDSQYINKAEKANSWNQSPLCAHRQEVTSTHTSKDSTYTALGWQWLGIHDSTVGNSTLRTNKHSKLLTTDVVL